MSTRVQDYQRWLKSLFGITTDQLPGIVDADSAMAANSDAKVASQKATKTALALKFDAASISKRTLRIQHTDLVDAVNGEAQAVNIGAVLPANAVVLGHEIQVDTLFSGGGATAVKMDLGGTDADGIVSQMDLFTGAATGSLAPSTGVHGQGKFSAQQLKATFTPDGGHTLDGLTAGDVTITVWYIILA